MGLFGGTGTDANGNPIFDLDRAPTRQEVITMLVRLLGKEAEAKAGTWSVPFSDIADWARPYVGYAYTNGLTNGTSATTYGGTDVVTASQYLTFVLRALGYEAGTDFQWDRAWELSDRIGLTSGQYNINTSSFTRGDVAIISAQALNVSLKNLPYTLPNTTILPEASKNNAPSSVKIDILTKTRDGFKSASKAFYACANALLLLSEKTDTPNLIVSSTQQSQRQFINATSELSSAIALCGEYEDTQDVKSELSQIVTELSKFTSYSLSGTPQNTVEYLLLVSSSDSSSNLEKLLEQIEQWAK